MPCNLMDENNQIPRFRELVDLDKSHKCTGTPRNQIVNPFPFLSKVGSDKTSKIDKVIFLLLPIIFIKLATFQNLQIRFIILN